jgi:predicted O-linked N-acetylglucosamine transferase (SPINDLY family)
MGASYIDYLIADSTLIPSAHQRYYSEKIVYLPNTYMPHDEVQRCLSDHSFNRSEFGLPEDAIVFSCFNNAYKINPYIFEVWMRILAKIPESIIWLSHTNRTVIANLKAEAASAGIDPARLIFANRLDSTAEHLARHRLADLFLDTVPYNAHTTASDALWAGLPVLTCVGETFPGRVAASLLNATGLPELITTTLEEYERTAIALAAHPEKLGAIKDKLAKNRRTTPLFDTKLFTKHIEAAYTKMYQRHQTKLAPDEIIVVD